MKYNDRYTQKATEKYLNKLETPTSDREKRRRRERELKKFEIKICTSVDRIWWKSLTLEMKEDAYRDYLNSSRFNFNFDFNNWAKNYQKNNKPDTVLYRENRIEDLLT